MREITVERLKMIAIMAMVIDHFSYLYIPSSEVMAAVLHGIGKTAAPVMIFLLVEGYLHTKNLWVYFSRLFICMLISEVPYLLYGSICKEVSIAPINVIGMLILGLLAIFIYENVQDRIIKWSVILIIILVSSLTDWGVFGILMALGFYIYRNYPVKRAFIIIGISVAKILLIVYETKEVVTILPYLISLIFVIALISKYKGKKGCRSKVIKYGFYLAYPVQFLVIFTLYNLYR